MVNEKLKKMKTWRFNNLTLKLLILIHNERPYKRYYYQPLDKAGFLREFIKELRIYTVIFGKAAYLPFCPKFNKQQFEGKRKSKIKILYEILFWALKYKEVCKYYFLYGLDIKGKKPNNYVAYTEFRVLRNILNIRQRENIKTLYTFNYLALARDKFVFYQYCKSLNIPYPKTIALVSKGKISWYDSVRMNFSNFETIIHNDFDAFCKEVTGESGKGAFPLKVTDGKCYINDIEISFAEVRDKFGQANFIILLVLSKYWILLV